MRILGAVFACVMPILYAQGPHPPSIAEIDAAFIRDTVNALGAVVRQEYVDPEIGAGVDASLQQRLAEGKYANIHTLEPLAATLTRELHSLTRDKHLAVDLVLADKTRELRRLSSNFGIQRVEILSGNVGYLNITGFDRREQARGPISAAMQLLVHADALIVDLRVNGGGSPDTAALFASYFFDTTAVPLFQIVPRSGKGALSYRTEETPFPERNGRRPVYLLTSAHTFSAGEGLAFLFQEMHRGEVIGETTAGAANPGRPYPLNIHLTVTVPNGRVRSAVSGGNWEGVGVVPAVKTTEAEALRVAHLRALRKLIELAPDGPRRAALERDLHNFAKTR